MALKSINLTQGINPSIDVRGNYAPIPENGNIDAPFTLNQASAQSGGLSPLYNKSLSASTEAIRTVDDSGRVVEIKTLYGIDSAIIASALPLDSGAGAPLIKAVKKVQAYLYAFGVGTDTYPYIAYSTDNGATWSGGTADSTYSTTVQDIAYNGTYYAITDFDNRILSGAGTGWTWSAMSGTCPAFTFCMQWTGNKFIAVVSGSTNLIYTSTNGTTWASYTMPTTALWGSIACDTAIGRVLITAFNKNYFAYSDDFGSNFANQTLSVTDNWQCVIQITNAGSFFGIFSPTRSVVVNANPLTISTAVTTNRTICAAVSQISPYYFSGGNVITGIYKKIVAVFGTKILYSNDLVTWYELGRSSNTSSLYSVAWTGTYFVTNQVGRNVIRMYDYNQQQAFIDSVRVGESFCQYGLKSFTNSEYSDIMYTASIGLIGCKISNNIITVDILNQTTLAYSSTYFSMTVNNGRSVSFIRNTNYDMIYYSSGNTYFIIGGVVSGYVAYNYTTAYYLGAKYLLGNEKISNADGNAMSQFVSYTLGSPCTAVTTKIGWFISYYDSGVFGIVGIEYDTPNYKFEHYTIASTGVFTEVVTHGSGATIIYGINGIYAEFEPYHKYAAFAPYITDTGKSGTGADGIDILGYFSIIDRYNISTDVYLYFRATYNRALKSCDGISISDNLKYIGRQFDIANIDYTYRPRLFAITAGYPILVYRQSDGKLAYCKFDYTANCTTQLTKISQNKYLINTCDPYNLLDTQPGTVVPTNFDYAGAVEYTAAAADQETQKIVNDLYETEHNSEAGLVPQGDDNITNVYDQKLYYSSLTRNHYVIDGVLIESNKFNSEAYIDDHNTSPIPMYSTIQNSYVSVDGEIYPLDSTRPLNISFLSQISNQVYNSPTFFYLFGNYYMFDGQQIYLLDATNQTATPTCRAYGMTFVTFSQTVAFFFSYADSSLWMFDGGRALQKYSQLNRIFSPGASAITGDYSTKDSALILSKGGNVAVSFQDKMSYLPSFTSLYVRENGIYYNPVGGGIYQLSFFDYDGGFSPIAMAWQSAYFKNPATMQSVKEVQIYLKDNGTDSAGTFTINYYSFNESNTLTTNSKTFTFTGAEWDSGGYMSIRYFPAYNSVYGFSIGISTAMDILIVDVSVSVSNISETVVPSTLSK